jgi:hypothetical protein
VCGLQCKLCSFLAVVLSTGVCELQLNKATVVCCCTVQILVVCSGTNSHGFCTWDPLLYSPSMQLIDLRMSCCLVQDSSVQVWLGSACIRHLVFFVFGA